MMKQTPWKLKFQEIVDRLMEANPDAVLADGFEEALVGIAEIFNRSIALYDKGKCLKILTTRDKMSNENASEFFEFNKQGAYVGENIPAFATMGRQLQLNHPSGPG